MLAEEYGTHEWSKGLGGNGAFIVITGGLGAAVAPTSMTGTTLAYGFTGLSLAGGTANVMEAGACYREGQYGAMTLNLGSAAVNFFFGVRGAKQLYMSRPTGTAVPKEAGVRSANGALAAEEAASYRSYLNAKFGRTGNLNADINARGIEDAIRVNAYRSVSYARLSGTTTAQGFGTKAHQFFERFNNRLANRVAGTYEVATEQFRDPLGFVVANRAPGSIGADVLYRPWGSSAPPTIFDLKTFNTVQRPISTARQNEFFFRFRATAQEIYVPQW